ISITFIVIGKLSCIKSHFLVPRFALIELRRGERILKVLVQPLPIFIGFIQGVRQYDRCVGSFFIQHNIAVISGEREIVNSILMAVFSGKQLGILGVHLILLGVGRVVGQITLIPQIGLGECCGPFGLLVLFLMPSGNLQNVVTQ